MNKVNDENKRMKNVNKKLIFTVIAILYICLLLIVINKYISENRYWEIDFANRSISAERGQVITLDARIKNKMYYVMSSNDNYFVSYHINNENNETLVYDNPRTVIEAIEPGYERDVLINFQIPEQAGKYIIEIDIVKENEYWFKDRGEKTSFIDLTVY